MKKSFIFCFLAFTLIFFKGLSAQSSKILDHNCTRIEIIPQEFIEKSKQNLKIAYGHTSHGSQITTGISLLSQKNGSIFKYNSGNGTLTYNENSLSGDLGNPDRTTWAKSTRDLLNKPNNTFNVIMWSWCGQVSSSTESDINTYLSLMDKLESDFPDIKFIYFTGHLDGTGNNGNLNQRNNQIREFCQKNNKFLYDFADIESYDPDGKYFLDKKATDNCDYQSVSGTKNWAAEWCNNNPGKCSNCSCAHSQCLNCMMKANAFWWMLAKISGWSGPDETPVTNSNYELALNLYPNPAQEIVSANISLSEADYVNCDLFDSMGNKVEELLKDCYLQTGVTKINHEIVTLSAGVYFIRLKFSKTQIYKCFIKI